MHLILATPGLHAICRIDVANGASKNSKPGRYSSDSKMPSDSRTWAQVSFTQVSLRRGPRMSLLCDVV